MNDKNVVVGDLLKIPAFREKMSLVNHHGDLNKAINHVTIMEAPDLYEWVTGGEFVLTVWYAFSKSPELQIEAFKHLAQRISAISIKTERYIERIPPEIIRIADEYRLPVFEMKRETKFREVVQIISAEIQNHQTNLLLEVERYYQGLIKLSLSSNELSCLLQELGKKIRTRCFCLNHEFKVVGMSMDRGASKKTVREYAEEIKKEWHKNPAATDFSINSLHVFQCRARNRFLGYLVVIQEETLSEKMLLMSRQTSSFLSFKLWENYETQQKALQNFWRELTGQDKVTESFIQHKLTSFGLNSNGGITVAVLIQAAESEKVVEYIRTLFEEMLDWLDDGYHILLLPNAGIASKKAHWAVKVQEYIRNKRYASIVVIAPKIDQLRALKENAHIAWQTAQIIPIVAAGGRVEEAVDWLHVNLIQRSAVSPEYEFLFQHILEPLIEHDRRYQSCLQETLQAALFSDTLEQAAQNLHIHINTLRYRLGKVSEITHKNFFRVHDRYLLFTACLIGKLRSE